MIISYFLLVVTGLPLVISKTLENCTDIQINNGPLITPCVSEVILNNGENYTLTCKGTTNITFRQQEVSEVFTSNFTIVNKTTPIFEDLYTSEVTLELYHVDRYAIGYYACFDDTVDPNIVDNLTEEPKNDEHVSYIYVYVNGTDSLFAPMTQIIMPICNKILIQCRPTTPDVTIELMSSKSQNKTPKYSEKIGFELKSCSNAFTCKGHRGEQIEKRYIRIFSVSEPPKPKIEADSRYFINGKPFTLNCSVSKPSNTIAVLSWHFPAGLIMNSQEYNLQNGSLYVNLTIYNATERHAGTYTCLSTNGCLNETSTVTKIYSAGPILNLTLKGDPILITLQRRISKNFIVDAYPKPTYKMLKNGKEIPTDKGKYSLKYSSITKYQTFVIQPCDITDNANFTLVASNGLTKNVSFTAGKAVGPSINCGVRNKTCVMGMDTTISCDVAGFELPNVTWFASNKNKNYTLVSSEDIQTSVYNKTVRQKFMCGNINKITCQATNRFDSVKEELNLFVYEIINGFGISDSSINTADKSLVVLQSGNISVKCLASLFDFTNVTWLTNDGEEAKGMVEYLNPTEFSHVAVLKINNIDLVHSGQYQCKGLRKNGTSAFDDITINVLELKPTTIEDPTDVIEDVYRFEIKHINCIAVGAPLPKINWYKDGDELLVKDYDNVKIHNKNLNHTAIQSTIEINQTQPHNIGMYECVANSSINTQTKSFTLNFKVDKEANIYVKHYIIIIVVIIITLIILIVYLAVKVRKEKRFKNELLAAGLLYFKEGVTKSINPDLGIDEQAELLPYDERFEFPADKLECGKQLGAGAFGVVYKAEARGIIDAEVTTTVAVKMVKKTADNMYIKALASELKIMVHLGKHINIVNLLGACTKNVGKRELVVIVEYCKYGNIHNYLQRHRDAFIDQLETDNKEKLGKVNRAYTSSSCGSTGAQSDYFGSTNTQNTEHTMLNTANTVRSGRKNIPSNCPPVEEVKASEGYVQPEWRSNYQSDYSYDGRSPRPVTSRDLLTWAFQIARGMEYLASRKVLHGDLAARNILLADDNIVKICDFGLAKSIYKNDEYQKNENCLLPVKWLAIECMMDRIFSTQSDVWSFGIVLWELFTLAKTPYPNLPPADILPFLTAGNRLSKPEYADNKIYDVMKNCWEAKPTMRPSFTQLQETLGSFLEDNVRNYYVELNNSNVTSNNKPGQEDYLAMVCAPDYKNMVTPSPQYVNANNSFFPLTPDRVDGEGYLQMSPRNQCTFSPRDANTEFNFDLLKLNHKPSESSSCGSELTPMLTLNNLPARSGSESDHEGNSSFMSACPRIVEEADEVFEVTKSLNDTNNEKNLQHSAVTNPTYITFEDINEKTKVNNNSYVNIDVPNGLVK